MGNEKHITESQLQQLRTQDLDDRREFRRRAWRSLKTLAGWAALLSLLGTAMYGLLGRLASILHIGQR